MRVSFLGLGAIGTPMAAHLANPSMQLTVWNRSREKAETFAKQHDAHCAETPADAARDADVIVTCLPSSKEVRALLDGEEGLLAGIRNGALFIDCTSGDPATSREIASILAERDVAFIDAPVSGGVKGAIAGTLTIMCGADPAHLERAKPVLETFGGKIIHCGPVGTGDAVKAMNQALLAIHIWSAGEALAALAKLGVEAGTALEVINGSSGRSNASENLFPERVLGRAYPRTFKLALLDKDVAIAAGIASDEKIPAPLIDIAARLMHEAHGELGEEADHVEAVRVIESRAGVRIS